MSERQLLCAWLSYMIFPQVSDYVSYICVNLMPGSKPSSKGCKYIRRSDHLISTFIEVLNNVLSTYLETDPFYICAVQVQ